MLTALVHILQGELLKRRRNEILVGCFCSFPTAQPSWVRVTVQTDQYGGEHLEIVYMAGSDDHNLYLVGINSLPLQQYGSPRETTSSPSSTLLVMEYAAALGRGGLV